jgi:type IV pilus assembly protein PilB
MTKMHSLANSLADTTLDNIGLALAEDPTLSTADFPVVRFINKIILDSLARHASDIHFEPFENAYRIRLRIDGILHEVSQPDANLAPRLAARLKIMSGLDISERRIPQDGRFKLNLSTGKSVGFRVNTCPTLFGEKIVLRILDPHAAKIGIDKLGFAAPQKKMFVDALDKTQGMILVTGPTGSGKTVTLYTALHYLNNSTKNISTAEDPVEIYLPGVNQVNINVKTGLDFAAALRAFLRQDPDIIMVGEIRDQETAEIAIKAAQTGHLVFSTLHTNSAAETLTRLANMGIAGFNIATTVNLVIAQRLVRCLCEQCKRPHTLDESMLLAHGFKIEDILSLKLFQAVGCNACNAGYKGRLGVFEVLRISPAISDLIMRHGTSIDIMQQALTEGMTTLRQDAVDKVRQGLTSLDEINRVLG